MRIPTKSLPQQLRQFTKKHTACVEVLRDGAGITTHGAYWDGGSRSVYRFVHLATGKTTQPNYSTNPPQFGGIIETLRPEKGWAVLVTGEFCGKMATMWIHIRPDDIAAFCGVTGLEVGDMPPAILADYLEERGEEKASAMMREIFAS